jgi:hypothetical protein
MEVSPSTRAGSLRQAITVGLAALAAWTYEIVDALGRCWFLLLATLSVGVVIALVPQGREAVWAAGGTGRAWQLPGFFVTSTLGAVLVTLFASQILEARREDELTGSRLRGHACFAVPGILGLLAAFLVPLLLVHLVGSSPFLLPQRRRELQELGVLFQTLVMPAVVVARCPTVLVRIARPWTLDRRQLLGSIGLLAFFLLGLLLSSSPFVTGALVLLVGLAILDGLWWEVGLDTASRRYRRWAGLVLSIGWIAAGCWVAAAPESRAPAVGPAAVILFAMYFWLALAYVLFFFLGRWLSQGVSIALFLTALCLFLSGPFNMHAVRTIAGGRPAAQAAPGRLSQHIDDWLDSRRSAIEAADGPYPVFIVAAEGGGIRAAYWTAGLLGAIQDAESAFAEHTLGISGVSGGSLGAATFAALVAEARRGGSDMARSAADVGPLQRLAGNVLGRDYLSPVLATMLIPDVAACLLHGAWAEDRAAVLERTLELGWREAVGTDAFQDPLDAPWRDAALHHVPTVFMNSTEAGSGRRIVNSHVVLDPAHSSAFSLPVALPPQSLRLSTAILLSARFPAISPIASLDPSSAEGPLHIVDGGYVDNSGTLTAAEIAEALAASAARLGLADRIRTVAIVITDDPIPLGAQESRADLRNRAGIVATAIGALLSPFETLDHVRKALSSKHGESLATLIRGRGGEVLDGFALEASRMEFPLGWMLAPATRSALTQQISDLKADPRGDLQRIKDLIRAGRPRE